MICLLSDLNNAQQHEDNPVRIDCKILSDEDSWVTTEYLLGIAVHLQSNT